jgi:hypothetical protein
MQDNIIFIIGCFVLAGLMCEVIWSLFLYALRKLEYFFYRRYLDKVSRDVMMEYMQNPKFLKNEDDSKWWKGYKT